MSATATRAQPGYRAGTASGRAVRVDRAAADARPHYDHDGGGGRLPWPRIAEKYRHSPRRPHHLRRRQLRQMASASIRAYSGREDAAPHVARIDDSGTSTPIAALGAGGSWRGGTSAGDGLSGGIGRELAGLSHGGLANLTRKRIGSENAAGRRESWRPGRWPASGCCRLMIAQRRRSLLSGRQPRLRTRGASPTVTCACLGAR